MSSRRRRALLEAWQSRAPPRFGQAWEGAERLEDGWGPELLRAAYDRAMPGAATGVDGLPPSCVTGPYLEHLADEVAARRYAPTPLRRFVLPGKGRTVGVPTVADQVLVAAWKLWAEPKLEEKLGTGVWGFRPGRDRFGALRALCRPRVGRVLVRCDVRRMFESLDHEVLDRTAGDTWGWEARPWHARGWWRRPWNRGLAPWLMEQWVQAWSPGVGVPTGVAVSPLWANAYLREVDAVVAATPEVIAYVRYGDDFAVLAEEDVLGVIARALRRVRLALKPEKTRLHRLDRPGDWPARVLGVDLVPGALGGLVRRGEAG